LAGANSQSQYIEYYPGTVPIIISAPHGGTEEPSEISNRIAGCPTSDGLCVYEKDESCASTSECGIVTVRDSYTIEIARSIADTVEELLGARPYLVINNLNRKKMDANRDKYEGAQNDPIAVEAWETFHNFIQVSRQEMGRGVLFDIHQQGNRPCLEIGYLMSKSELMDEIYDINDSSLRLLGEETQLSGDDLIMGPDSFGALLTKHGACSVPSPNNPWPSNGDECYVDGCTPCDCRNWDGSCSDGSCDYFTGGYITQEYGSRDGGLSDAMQMETRVPDFNHYDCDCVDESNRESSNRSKAECVDTCDYYIADGRKYGNAIVDFYLRYYSQD